MAGGYPPQPPQGQQGYPPQGQQYPPQGQPMSAPPPGAVPVAAPYGVDPKTGMPFSDKQKGLAGILQLICVVVFFGGIGRLYMGHMGVGIAQLLLSCIGVGQIWSIIDGILIFANGGTDGKGYPLRD